MQKQLFIIFLFIIFILSGVFLIRTFVKSPPEEQGDFKISNMQLTSPSFNSNDFIPAKFTCDGLNINPKLKITGVPAEVESLVLIVDDPDASSGDWVHWLVWNIDPTVAVIEEGSLPVGVIQGRTDFGKNEYDGPCPPASRTGIHNYHFKLYALNVSFADLSPNTDKQKILKLMEGHILGKTELIGKYSR